MHPEHGDRELRARFQELREADQKEVPPFPRVWRKALSSRQRARGLRRARWIAAAGGVAAGVGLLAALFLGSPGTPQAPGEAAPMDGALFEWQSPTAFLLEWPGQDLWQEVPEVGDLPELSLETKGA